MVHAGFAMLNAVYGDVQLNSLTMDKGHKSKLHCHCSVPVVHSSRRDPLATCQLLCGNSKKLNTVSCNFCITLKPINFLEMIPALFVYEIEETGEVFTSFRVNPIKVVMEFQGSIPTMRQQVRNNILLVDELSIQDYREHLRKIDYLNFLVLFLNTINRLVKEDDSNDLLANWTEKINTCFQNACSELNCHVQMETWRKQYSLTFIKQSLFDFVKCQV